MTEYKRAYNLFDQLCEFVEINPKLARSRTRVQDVVTIRQLFCYHAIKRDRTGRPLLRLSLTQIGSVLGGLHHATVIHGANHFDNMLNSAKDRMYIDLFNDTKHLFDKLLYPKVQILNPLEDCNNDDKLYVLSGRKCEVCGGRGKMKNGINCLNCKDGLVDCFLMHIELK